MTITTASVPTSTEQLLLLRDSLAANDPLRIKLRNQAIEANLALSRRLAGRYTGRGESFDDLSQVAAYALIKAVDSYDPQRGVPFAAYTLPYILGSLKRHFRDTAWTIRIPRTLQELGQQTGAAIEDLGRLNGRTPTNADVAVHLGVTPGELRKANAARTAYRLTSLDAPSSHLIEANVGDLIGDTDPRLDQVDDRVTVQGLLNTLNPRARDILTLRFANDMTQATIATHVGLSQMHVSRILQETLTTLRTTIAGPAAGNTVALAAPPLTMTIPRPRRRALVSA